MKIRALSHILLVLFSTLPVAGLELTHQERANLQDVIPDSSKLTLINFWATWCVPCVAELEDLVWLDSVFANSDLTLLGVSLDTALPVELEVAADRASGMLEEKNIGYPNVLFTGSQKELADVWEIDSGIPFTVIVDSSTGRVLSSHRGRIDVKEVEKEIRKLLEDSTHTR